MCTPTVGSQDLSVGVAERLANLNVQPQAVIAEHGFCIPERVANLKVQTHSGIAEPRFLRSRTIGEA